MVNQELIEELLQRNANAQKRLQEATAKLQAAQQEHQAALADSGTWQSAINAVKKEMAAQNQPQPNSGQPAAATTPQQQIPISQPPAAKEEVNKTDLVRQILRQHPEGTRPTDIWRQLANQLKHRAYLYSILKRLKDRDEVSEKRGKYFTKGVPKIEEENRISTVVQ
jgi:hypothetical protein